MARLGKARWQVVTPLLEELLDASEAQREARLAQIRAEDHVLATDLASLLAIRAQVETERFLETPALDFVGAESALAGRTVGSYTLVREIGAGGMGTVWLARRGDGRYEGRAAVKFLNLALLGRGGAERFRREGNALARLAHPNIAHLIDAGALDGQPFLVLEYVEGEPVDAWCDARNLTTEARIKVFLQVLAPVSYAHSQLILHRDLKPSNILVTTEGQVKLLDFGIAKLLDDESAAMTQLAGRALTPDFAAPEQVQGLEVSTATDVYALGVLLFQLLTGAHPTAATSTNPVDRLRAVVEDEPRSLSEAALEASAATAKARATTPQGLARSLRGDLGNIVGKALKKAPAERYATVDAFAADLARFLANEPVIARADSRAYRAAKFVRRNRLPVAAATAMMVLLAAGVIGTTWQAIEARRERDEAIRQAEAARAKGTLVNLLLTALGEDDRPMTQREILERSTQLVIKQFASKPRIAVGLLLPIAGQYFTLGDTEKDLETMQRAAEFAAASGEQELVAQVACDTVNTQIRRGRVDLAREHLRSAQKALKQADRHGLESTVECMRAEADIELAVGNHARAIQIASLALIEAQRALPGSDSLYLTMLSYLVKWHRETGDLAAAYGELRTYQRHVERLGQTDSADYFAMSRTEALILMGWGEYRAAKAILDAVAARWRDPPPWFERTQAQMFMRFGDLASAQRALGSAASRARGQGDLETAAKAELWLALALEESGHLDEAHRVLAKVDAAQPVLQLDEPITPAIVQSILLFKQGAAEAAAKVIEADLTRIGHPQAKETVALGATLRTAALIGASNRDAATSLHAAQAAVTVAQHVARDPEQSADVGESLLMVARAQSRAGAMVEAATTAARAATCLANGLGDAHVLTREARQIASSQARAQRD